MKGSKRDRGNSHSTTKTSTTDSGCGTRSKARGPSNSTKGESSPVTGRRTKLQVRGDSSSLMVTSLWVSFKTQSGMVWVTTASQALTMSTKGSSSMIYLKEKVNSCIQVGISIRAASRQD